MNKLFLALLASATLLPASAAMAASIDGVISSGEYSTATVTYTPYNPASDTSLATFSAGNENVAEQTLFQVDPNHLGFDFAVKTLPAGLGLDDADASVGLQFTNVYFGNPTDGALVVFELGNSRAVNLNTGASYTYTAGLGILYADTPGTTYANGGLSSVSEAYIPFAAYNAVLTNLGIPNVAVGDTIQVRDLQAFSYGGNNAGGGNRFGSVTVAAGAVPEPASWAMMLVGFGTIGGAMRRRNRQTLAKA